MTHLTELAEDILKQARAIGASSAEVSISQDKGFSVNVRMGDVETVEHHQGNGVALTLYVGQKTGVASTSDFAPEAIQATVQKAYNIASYTQDDTFAGLADKELMATDFPDLDLYHPWSITPEQAIQLATECEDYARNQDARIVNSEGASVNTAQTNYVYANTHGFISTTRRTRHSINLSLIAKENESMERDYEYTIARDAKDLATPQQLAHNAAERTLKRLHARPLSTMQVPVIFEAKLARGLLGSFFSAISGGNLYRKSSFLLDSLGKSVFPKWVTIDQRPLLLKKLGSAAFDEEGVKTSQRNYIEDGILKSYVLGSYSARKLGLQTTGNAGGVYNAYITTQSYSLNDLLAQMGRGLLVTELIGQGVNLITGDYSRGAFGYWIENGEIQYPVHQITIAGNLKEMFLGIQAIADDVDSRGNINTGSMLIDRMTIAG